MWRSWPSDCPAAERRPLTLAAVGMTRWRARAVSWPTAHHSQRTRLTVSRRTPVRPAATIICYPRANAQTLRPPLHAAGAAATA